ncbi:larval cuticle protein 16/17-like [Armigeres subalbatus]|uniref:larval cuticle protein 16/17-like n=1 Tax=Armigeres subalbatus TaxID=124917 RepID=UPI002ED4342A
MNMGLRLVRVVWFALVFLRFERAQGSENAEESEVVINNYINRLHENSYLLSYTLSDGQFRYERGRYKTSVDKSKEPVWYVSGRYGYKSPDGQLFRFRYTADENGYRQHQLTADENFENGGIVGNRIDLKTLTSLVG